MASGGEVDGGGGGRRGFCVDVAQTESSEMSSMAATELADVIWTLSAKAASSEMSAMLAARHCALVEGGSSERNLFMKKYVYTQTCAGRAARRELHRAVGFIPAYKGFILS